MNDLNTNRIIPIARSSDLMYDRHFYLDPGFLSSRLVYYGIDINNPYNVPAVGSRYEMSEILNILPHLFADVVNNTCVHNNNKLHSTDDLNMFIPNNVQLKSTILLIRVYIMAFLSNCIAANDNTSATYLLNQYECIMYNSPLLMAHIVMSGLMPRNSNKIMLTLNTRFSIDTMASNDMLTAMYHRFIYASLECRNPLSPVLHSNRLSTNHGFGYHEMAYVQNLYSELLSDYNISTIFNRTSASITSENSTPIYIKIASLVHSIGNTCVRIFHNDHLDAEEESIRDWKDMGYRTPEREFTPEPDDKNVFTYKRTERNILFSSSDQRRLIDELVGGIYSRGNISEISNMTQTHRPEVRMLVDDNSLLLNEVFNELIFVILPRMLNSEAELYDAFSNGSNPTKSMGDIHYIISKVSADIRSKKAVLANYVDFHTATDFIETEVSYVVGGLCAVLSDIVLQISGAMLIYGEYDDSCFIVQTPEVVADIVIPMNMNDNFRELYDHVYGLMVSSVLLHTTSTVDLSICRALDESVDAMPRFVTNNTYN